MVESKWRHRLLLNGTRYVTVVVLRMAILSIWEINLSGVLVDIPFGVTMSHNYFIPFAPRTNRVTLSTLKRQPSPQ